jgi:DNA-binding transcriptional MerR regulator/methylmalonyl-CoA mutase cobalamin-binding subunit
LSIGEVAQATGFTPDTLRVWERRYGEPVPVRLPSGHRRFTREQVLWLRRVAEALARGHRPSRVVPLKEAELTLLLEAAETPDPHPDQTQLLVGCVREYQDAELRAHFETTLARQVPLVLMQETIGPLLVEVGRQWADGRLDVRHEHFVAELLSEWICSKRLQREARNLGPIAVVATLPGERHALGAAMAAWVCAERGLRTRLLGTEVPIDQLVAATRETKASFVLISVSLSTGGLDTDRMLAQLRRDLPSEIGLVIGGAGARSVRRGPRGVDCVDGVRSLDNWLLQRVRYASSSELL